tara:strand:+ start:174840 stop:175901 length:1062 start_codon:yes stop_codon:yes gene_type:complete
MTKFLRIIGLITVLLVLVKSLSFFTYDYTETDDRSFREAFNKDYGIYALDLPEDITLAGEFIPFEDPDIYERFDREMLVNTYWQSQTLLFFKRANRYFEIIEPILKEHNVPDDFKYLSLIESGFMNVVSPAGAVGFWQILKSTGKEYGLEINEQVDERYNVEKSTHAACKYLKEAYAEFNSWILAAASYNMGISGVKRQLERQNANSYFDLTLNSETARYVFRILAIKELMENPKKYGFNFRKKDLYQPIPTQTIKLDSSVTDFGLWAQNVGVNYRILKYHNPWLRQEYLKNSSGKSYFIKIPKKGHYWIDEMLISRDSANHHKSNDSIPVLDNTSESSQDQDSTAISRDTVQ